MCGIKYIKAGVMFPVIEEMLKEGRSVRITVTGSSMYPFLRENIDSIELSSSNFINIHRGDIVLILRDTGAYILHRILKKEKDRFYIVGDHQQWIEGPLRQDQLIAVAIAIWRKDKKIVCTNIWWKILSRAWLRLLPVRHVVLVLYHQYIGLRDRVHRLKSLLVKKGEG